MNKRKQKKAKEKREYLSIIQAIKKWIDINTKNKNSFINAMTSKLGILMYVCIRKTIWRPILLIKNCSFLFIAKAFKLRIRININIHWVHILFSIFFLLCHLLFTNMFYCYFEFYITEVTAIFFIYFIFLRNQSEEKIEKPKWNMLRKIIFIHFSLLLILIYFHILLAKKYNRKDFFKCLYE